MSEEVQERLFEIDPTPIVEDGVEYMLVHVQAHTRKVRVKKRGA